MRLSDPVIVSVDARKAMITLHIERVQRHFLMQDLVPSSLAISSKQYSGHTTGRPYVEGFPKATGDPQLGNDPIILNIELPCQEHDGNQVTK